MFSIHDVLLFIVPFEIEVLIIPISIFAAVSVFLNHSINAKKELLVCSIINEIKKEKKETEKKRNETEKMKTGLEKQIEGPKMSKEEPAQKDDEIKDKQLLESEIHRSEVLDEYITTIKKERKKFRLKDLEKIEADIDLIQFFAKKRSITMNTLKTYNEQRIECVDDGKQETNVTQP